MDGMLSQEEINALLNSGGADGAGAEGEEGLTDVEKDAIGEIANISMGTAATTLFSLVNQRVEISTPVVSYIDWDEIANTFVKPCVFIQISYTIGLDGSNLLVLKEADVMTITDLMMGGDGTNTEGELGELQLSAICEAMNQMMGSSATSLSSMLNKKIDISPPKADVIDINENLNGADIDPFLANKFVKISFKLEIGDLVDSEIMQLYPLSFAKEMYESYKNNMASDSTVAKDSAPTPDIEAAKQPEPAATQGAPAQQAPPMQGMPMQGQPMDPNMAGGYAMPPYGMPPYGYGQPVNVAPAQFSPFESNYSPMMQHENIDLIMDVPLEVTVELGRTKKSIQEILDFSPGTIIELNKIAGEPIDVLVNGKYVAKGEVVVIEESYGIRVTEIIK
ncbi:flagellar motor switch protein FliN/FliY [Acetitomaculum ruminis DSM 5522]|uniref:Flagellar motor switch protein FliN/FliY n=1 Tax=Acetitomaculum ruminis DSM 5522 TaxID=1120918 RepID=A0A1I0ZHC5_9FIRM|nr:flagellar motor switch phosphatase FliY [Acetitomaculum ruminis]SFB25169.1 flagellar motor switch protein FliN/FliY [Acetitomaculum ruminis DSM 5522]